MSTTIWGLSGSKQLKKVGLALATGATVQFFSGGTTTPLTVYTDSAATTPAESANLTVDGNGLWPSIFVPYGNYDYRVLDSDNTVIFTVSNVPNPEPVDSTATDANALLTTGDWIFGAIAGTRAGMVRANGRTLGSAASSATERANDDAEDLFTYLWNNLADGQAAVSGGRGASAAADWGANKTITLPDIRGGLPFGLDDMGNSAASRYGSATFAHGDATTAGSSVGSNTVTLIEANLPGHTHGIGTIATASGGAHTHTITGTTTSNGAHNHTITDPSHTHTISGAGNILIQSGAANGNVPTGGSSQIPSSSTYSAIATTVAAATTGISINNNADHSHSVTGSAASGGAHTHTMSGDTGSTGSGTAANIVSFGVLGTWFIKL